MSAAETTPPTPDLPENSGSSASRGHPVFATVEALIDSELDHYHIRREIGRGSMGVVFEAVDLHTQQRVALKVLPPNIRCSDKIIRRFLREAESVARLEHPNIVKIFGIGHKNSIYYYAMELIEGQPLEDQLKEGALLPFRQVAQLIIQACEAIQYAHNHQIIHRDIKPGNIIINDEGQVIITDFGLARPEKAATLTESGALVGTPIYMSPEQVLAKRGGVDKRTDIYSLGVTLYQLLTGIPPFTGESTQEILNQILEEEPRPPHRCRVNIPRALSIIAIKALEKDPRHRFQSAGELAEELTRYLEGIAIKSKPAGVFHLIGRRIRKHKIISALVILTVIITIAFCINLITSKKDLRESSTLLAEQENEQSYLEKINLAKELLVNPNIGMNLPSATHLLNEAITLFPERPEAHLYLGKAFAFKTDARKALRSFNRAVECAPGFCEALLARGLFLLEQGRQLNLENAILLGFSDLKKAIDIEPENPAILFAMASTLYNCANAVDLGFAERREMITHAYNYLMAVQEHGPSADAECLQAQIFIEFATNATFNLERRTNLENARKSLQRALEMDKNHSLAYQLFQEVEKRMEEPGILAEQVDARELLQQQGLATFYTHAEQIYDMLKTDLEKTLSETEKSKLLEGLMTVFLSPDPAVSLATQTLEAAAEEEVDLDYDGLLAKATIHIDRDNYTAAIKCFKRALILNPGNAHLLNYKIAQAYFNEDRLEQSLQHARLAYSQEPKNLSYLQLLSRILYDLGDKEGIKKLQDEAKANGTQSSFIDLDMPSFQKDGAKTIDH